MKHFFTQFLLIFFLFTVLHSNSNSQDLTPEQIYEKVNDCVVVILSYDFDGKLSKQGSGVVISDKGWVVTNYHVFAECEKIEIKHNDKIISYSDIIGVDVEKDILILKIEENIFPTIDISNGDNLKVGQRVYAIGSPLGMENSLSEGIISGLRNVTKENRNYIQITAGISPGSSGGAVVNSKGELIGISTLSLKEGQNLNFAIPTKDVTEISIGSYNTKEDIETNNYFYKGYNASISGNYDEAIEYYTNSLNISDNDANTYINRGAAYSSLSEYDKAISDYSKAIEIDPNNDLAFYNRGLAYSNLNEYNKAISDYNKSIEINPYNAVAFNNRGNIYSKLKEYDKAISEFNKAIEIDPDYANAFYNRGNAYSNLKEWMKGISNYNKAIEIEPDYANAYYNRGIAYYYTNMITNACEDVNKSYSLGNQDAIKFLRANCK